VVIGGVMQHIEEAGVHSGDSACVLPSYWVNPSAMEVMRQQARQLALALNVRGLMNVQFGVKDDVVYVLEVNPRASRTVPFVSKATGVPLAKLAAKIMVGRTLPELGLFAEPELAGHFVKETVFPFKKFPGVDTLLGPEMRSTGEAMGVGRSFGNAFAKAQQASGFAVPGRGTVFVSVNQHDRLSVLPIVEQLGELGFRVVATGGTADFLAKRGLNVRRTFKVNEEGRPNILDLIKNGEIDIAINTPLGAESRRDEMILRRECYELNVLLITTLSAAQATVEAIRSLRENRLEPVALQDLYPARWQGQPRSAPGAAAVRPEPLEI
jgi:carbamoyl-phosphate synthase large subunit